MRARLPLRRSAASASAAIPPAAPTLRTYHSVATASSSSRLRCTPSTIFTLPLFFLYPALTPPPRRNASSSSASAASAVTATGSAEVSNQREQRTRRKDKLGFFDASQPGGEVEERVGKGKERQKDVTSDLQQESVIQELVNRSGAQREAASFKDSADTSMSERPGIAASEMYATERVREMLKRGKTLQAAQCMSLVLRHDKSKAAQKLAQESLQLLCQPERVNPTARMQRKLPSRAHAEAAAELFYALATPGRSAPEYVRALMGGDAQHGTGGLHAAVQVLRVLLERSWSGQEQEGARGASWQQHQHVSTNLLVTFQEAFEKSADAVRRSDLERSKHAKVLKKEHAQATLALGQLLVDRLLPPPPASQAQSNSRRRFEVLTWALRTVTRPPTNESSHSPNERARRALIDEYLQGLIGNKSVARINPTHRHASLITVDEFNALLCDALRQRADSTVALQLLRAMLAHGIQPDSVSVNILLHRATRRQDTRLTAAALQITAKSAESSNRSASNAPLAPSSAPALISQVRAAMHSGDTHRLVALLAFATASSQFRVERHGPVIPFPTHRPGLGRSAPSKTTWQSTSGTSPHRLMRLLYPVFSLRRRPRLRLRIARLQEAVKLAPRDRIAAAEMARATADLRSSTKQQQQYEGPTVHPRVLTSAHNLCVKAGATGLAWRVWQLLRRVALRSLASAEPKERWVVPLQAATAQMQLYAREARKGLSIGQRAVEASLPLPPPHLRPLRVRLRTSNRSRRYALGYGTLPPRSVRRRNALAGKGTQAPRVQRWLVARRTAARDYEWLMRHWEENGGNVRPDALFFGAALDVFTRARGTRARKQRRWPVPRGNVGAKTTPEMGEAQAAASPNSNEHVDGFGSGANQRTDNGDTGSNAHDDYDDSEAHAQRTKAEAWTHMIRRIIADMLAVGLTVPIIFTHFVPRHKPPGGATSAAEASAMARMHQQQIGRRGAARGAGRE